MEVEAPKCSYAVGNTLKLQLKTPHDEQTVDATITKVFEPFTLSCAMVVLLDSPTLALKDQMVLKFFDRRFATQLRRDQRYDTWTPCIEQQYHQFILGGGAAEFINKLETVDDFVQDEGDNWNAAENEAFHDHMRDLYNNEVETYDTLKDLQGKDIPHRVACVTFPNPSSTQTTSIGEYVDIPGILLQYIEGFPLADVAAHAPQECWQAICEEAIRIVHLISDRGILNEDVKTRSFIVRQTSEKEFKPVMMDFALCKFRRDFGDDEDWRKWVAMQDEEGAVGFVMQRYLQGGFVYNRSARYRKGDKDFMSEA